MPPLRQTYHRQVKAANVPQRGVAPVPLVGLDRVASQQPPQGGIKRYLACRAGGATKGSTASSPESGAISHSRAAANVPLRGVAPFPLVGLDRVASQQPPESITARDWRLECGKARSGKARSLRVKTRVRRCCSSGGKRRPVRQAIRRK